MDLVERDLAVLWHPATHWDDLEVAPPVAIVRAAGCWLHPASGPPILDAISSWWTSVHGHGHPAIVAAVQRQVATLDHVMLAGFTHAPAVALAERLLERCGPCYGRVFYADCGSAAIEVALKLSFQSRVLTGQPQRTRFATLANAYHGETLGALSVTGDGPYRRVFAPLLPAPVVLPAPAIVDHDHADLATDAGADDPATAAAIATLRAHADELSALIVEPLVQCAGRMTMTGAGFYRRIAAEARALGIHVIADEIAVGFGRTGTLLASAWAGVEPDMIALSKGLTGGVLPLAALVLRAGFEQPFRGDPSRSFLHSHTFTGNPIACAAALASLELFEEHDRAGGSGPLIARLRAARHEVAAACPAIRHHRQAGSIVAFELEPGLAAAHGGRLGRALRVAALTHGVLLRPLHDVIYWMPPLVLDEAELAHLVAGTVATITAIARA
jgi:adenosylmethionine-8-amino-7-oxononanoate aminotransferase